MTLVAYEILKFVSRVWQDTYQGASALTLPLGFLIDVFALWLYFYTDTTPEFNSKCPY